MFQTFDYVFEFSRCYGWECIVESGDVCCRMRDTRNSVCVVNESVEWFLNVFSQCFRKCFALFSISCISLFRSISGVVEYRVFIKVAKYGSMCFFLSISIT